MTLTSFFVYSVVGGVCILLLQKFPFRKLPFFGKDGFLVDLFSCGLCLGVWVYAFLAWAFGANLLSEYFYVPVVSELVTGGLTSLLAHLVRLGWMEQFGKLEL